MRHDVLNERVLYDFWKYVEIVLDILIFSASNWNTSLGKIFTSLRKESSANYCLVYVYILIYFSHRKREEVQYNYNHNQKMYLTFENNHEQKDQFAGSKISRLVGW